jgi:hypothetical protein
VIGKEGRLILAGSGEARDEAGRRLYVIDVDDDGGGFGKEDGVVLSGAWWKARIRGCCACGRAESMSRNISISEEQVSTSEIWEIRGG